MRRKRRSRFGLPRFRPDFNSAIPTERVFARPRRPFWLPGLPGATSGVGDFKLRWGGLVGGFGRLRLLAALLRLTVAFGRRGRRQRFEGDLAGGQLLEGVL